VGFYCQGNFNSDKPAPQEGFTSTPALRLPANCSSPDFSWTGGGEHFSILQTKPVAREGPTNQMFWAPIRLLPSMATPKPWRGLDQIHGWLR